MINNNNDNNNEEEILVKWNPSLMCEVDLKSPNDFLMVKETLSRIGIASATKKVLYQSCHILHKQGHYFIMHFKEMFCLDGKTTEIPLLDLNRRTTIASLLEDWGLLTLRTKPEKDNILPSLKAIKIVPFNEKKNWTLVPKYAIGKIHKIGS